MTRFIIGFIILVLVVVLAALFAEWTLHCPDCPEPVYVNYDDGLRAGMIRALKFDSFCLTQNPTPEQLDSASKAMAALFTPDTKVIIYADPVVVFDPDSAFAKSYQWHSTAYVTYPLSDSIAVLNDLVAVLNERLDWLWNLRCEVQAVSERVHNSYDWAFDTAIALPDPCPGMVSIAAVDSLFEELFEMDIKDPYHGHIQFQYPGLGRDYAVTAETAEKALLRFKQARGL